MMQEVLGSSPTGAKKRACLVCALDASGSILKNMLYSTVIIRLPVHSLKGFGPSGFDLVKKYSKLSVSQPLRQKKWKTQFLLRFSAEHSYILSLLKLLKMLMAKN